MVQLFHLLVFAEHKITNLKRCMHLNCNIIYKIAKIWKQPKCPLIDEWIKKMWCMYIQWNTT